MSTRIKRTHPTPSRQSPIIKLFALLAVMILIWHIKPMAGLAAPATEGTVPLVQSEAADMPIKNALPQPGQIEPTAPLTTPISLAAPQELPEETNQTHAVCPPAEDVGAISGPNMLAGSFFNTATYIAGAILPDAILKERANILLLGSDSRSGEKQGHADTMILVTVDPISKTAGMLSIPRDLWVSIPGYGENRINQVYRLGEIKGHLGGGPALAIETIQANLGVTVHHYVLIDFAGFKQIVDTLGGIEICVPETLDSATYYGYVAETINKVAYYSYVPASPDEVNRTVEGDKEIETVERDQNRIDSTAGQTAEAGNNDGYKFLYIEAGLHTLDGHTALRYARSRASVTADFARAQRQQAVLLAMREKALQIGIIPKIPELWGAMSHIVETDLQLADIWQLASLAYEISLTDIQTGAISHGQTTDYTTGSGARVLLPQRAEIKVLVDDMFGPSNPTALLTQVEIEIAQAETAHNDAAQAGQVQSVISNPSATLRTSLQSLISD